VYFTGESTSQDIILPAGTTAFYFYVEPDPFDKYTFEVTCGGASSGPFTVVGDSGARYVGVYDDSGGTLSNTITISCDVGFASGEYGWAGGQTQPSCIKGVVRGPGVEIDRALVIAVELSTKDRFGALTEQGGYRIECPEGDYIVIAIKRPYSPAWQIVTVPPDGCAVANFDLK
jgi:hypothetical protein